LSRALQRTMSQFLQQALAQLQQANGRRADSEQQRIPCNLHSQGCTNYVRVGAPFALCDDCAARMERANPSPVQTPLATPVPICPSTCTQPSPPAPSASSASEPPRQGDLTPDQKSYHQRLAREAIEFVNSRCRNLPTERQADIRRRTAILLQEDAPGAGAVLNVEHEIARRLQTGLTYLKTPSVYNSTAGRGHLHFLLQCLSDAAATDDDDPYQKLIAKQLGINLATFKMCAAERKEHNLGYLPTAAPRKGAVQPWLIEVLPVAPWSTPCCDPKILSNPVPTSSFQVSFFDFCVGFFALSPPTLGAANGPWSAPGV